MKIEFSTLAGKTCVHEVDESLSVAALKEELYVPLGIDQLDELKLFRGTSELLDSQVVAQAGGGPVQVIVQSTPRRARQLLNKYREDSEDYENGDITFPDVQAAARAASCLLAHLGSEDLADFMGYVRQELVMLTLPLWEGWSSGPELTDPNADFRQCAMNVDTDMLNLHSIDFPGSIMAEHLEQSFRCLWKGYAPGQVCIDLQSRCWQNSLEEALQMKSFVEHAALQLERLIQAEDDETMQQALAQAISSLMKLPARLPLYGVDRRKKSQRCQELLEFCCQETYDEPSSRHTAAVGLAMAIGDKLQDMADLAAAEYDPIPAAALDSMAQCARDYMSQRMHEIFHQPSLLQRADQATQLSSKRGMMSNNTSHSQVEAENQDMASPVDDSVTLRASMDRKAPGSATQEPEESDPLAEEQADLCKAILLSKEDMPRQLNADGVVVYRLDRHVRSPEVQAALMESAELADCRRSVLQAGCQLQPEWGNGAWIFIPMTKDVFDESNLVLTNKDVVMLSQDEAAVKSALKAIPGSSRKRPKLQPVLPSDRLAGQDREATPLDESVAAPPSQGGASSSSARAVSQQAVDDTAAVEDEPSGQRKRVSDNEPEVVQRRTFYELNDRFAGLTISSGDSCRSAP